MGDKQFSFEVEKEMIDEHIDKDKPPKPKAKKNPKITTQRGMGMQIKIKQIAKLGTYSLVKSIPKKKETIFNHMKWVWVYLIITQTIQTLVCIWFIINEITGG